MNIHIKYDNIDARIETQIPNSVINKIHMYLRYRPHGYQHVYSFKSKRWDGYNYLFNMNTLSFRKGLLDRVVRFLSSDGHNVYTKYAASECGCINVNVNRNTIRPYEFQESMADAASNSSHGGLIISPTGSGKTTTIALTIDKLKTKTIVLVTDLVLLDQMNQSLTRLLETDIGMIGDGEFILKDITVSTIQSLLSIKKAKSVKSAEKHKEFLEWARGVGTVIFDEAHMADIDSVKLTIDFFSSASRFLGFSATPYIWDFDSEAKESLELEQHFGGIIFDSRKNYDFVDLGLRVPIYAQIENVVPLNDKYDTIKKVDRYSGKTVLDVTANFKLALDTEILNNPFYHLHIVDKVKNFTSNGHSVFVHAAHNLKFGNDLHELIPGSSLINGSTPRLERRKTYDAMRNKDILCLVSDIGGCGLDIPCLNVMVLASDLQDVRQVMGRVARKSKDKDYGLIVDTNIQTSFLSKHAKCRQNQYKEEGIPGMP